MEELSECQSQVLLYSMPFFWPRAKILHKPSYSFLDSDLQTLYHLLRLSSVHQQPPLSAKPWTRGMGTSNDNLHETENIVGDCKHIERGHLSYKCEFFCHLISPKRSRSIAHSFVIQNYEEIFCSVSPSVYSLFCTDVNSKQFQNWQVIISH